ncbi:hypothetical protein FACS1894169_12830 [Bacteroidia bacterium]|nr:hypothetical protein FACS1894169_12830 [Bacteroidia bacterium]
MIFCLMTCGGGEKPAAESQALQDAVRGDAPRRFVLPVIPGELTRAGERAGYLAAHYWDHFDFSDTACVHLPQITEQALADYLDVFSHTDRAAVEASIPAMLDRARREDRSGTMYRHFISLYKKYLYDPNSPVRNEEYYIPVVRYILGDSLTVEADRQRAGFELEMLLKNRLGAPATDVSYTLANGQTGRLYSLRKEYTLLFFYNPGCPACKETTASLASSEVINRLLLSGRLDILAVYPDSDLDLWKKHAGEMPSTWLVSYDKGQSLFGRKLYDLKAIPSLYLLDALKHVLLKDAAAEAVEQYLAEQSGPA